MTARSWTSVHQTTHEVQQAADIEWAVLHLVRDVVRPGLRRGLAARVTAVLDTDVIDGLALRQQLNCLVDSTGGRHPFTEPAVRPAIMNFWPNM